jgi:hypothetical protein
LSELLTKQQILAGKKGTEEVEIASLDCKVVIRPLTDGQWALVQHTATDGLQMIVRENGREQEMDAGRSSVNNHRAEILCCKMGLVEPWSDAELDSLPAGSVTAIANAVKLLSGVSDDEVGQSILDEAIQSFRDESGGADDSVPAPDGPASDQ